MYTLAGVKEEALLELLPQLGCVLSKHRFPEWYFSLLELGVEFQNLYFKLTFWVIVGCVLIRDSLS